MSGRIMNLTLPVVITEIEQVLEAYPYHPYQQAFAIPDLRQKLIAYVLSQVRSLYTVEFNDPGQTLVQSISASLTERLQIEAIIRQGIQQMIQENSDWINHHIPRNANPAFEPSHWFG